MNYTEMNFIMGTLPGSLRSWANGGQALSLAEIEAAERGWQMDLIGALDSGRWSRSEINEAWEDWLEIKSQEIADIDGSEEAA